MKIGQTIFNAEIPKVADLPDTFAQVAQNCDISRGDLRPIRAPIKIEAITPTSAKSLYYHTENGNEHWVTSANVRHYAKNSVVDDTYERVFFTGEAEPRFFAKDNISGGGFDPDTDYYKLGIPAPANAPTVASTGGGATYRGYVYSYANHYGDEGPPSAVGSDDDFDSGAVAISAIASAPSDRAIDRIYLYRTNASATGTSEYQFVLQAKFFTATTAFVSGDFTVYSGALYKCTSNHTGAWNPANFTAGDDVADADLLSVYPKINFDPPPDNLAGLMLLSNGSMVGFYGNALYFSEPFYNHAYPTDYILPIGPEIVGIASEKNTIFVFTDGNPYIVYGSHPSQMTKMKSSEQYPGINIKGVCSGNGGGFSVTQSGIVFGQGEGFVNILQGLIAPYNWQQYALSTTSLYWFDKRLFVCDTTKRKAFIVDFKEYENSNTLQIVPINVIIHTAHVGSDGNFYIISDDESAVSESEPPASMPLCVKQWEGSSYNYLKYTYRSKKFWFNAPLCFASVFVDIDTDFYNTLEEQIDLVELNETIFAGGLTGGIGIDGPIGGGHSIAGDEMLSVEIIMSSLDVTFKFYADDVLKKTRVIRGKTDQFRLPRQIMKRMYYYELSGQIPISRISIATSSDEL